VNAPGYVSSAEPAREGLDDGARTCYRRRVLMLEVKLAGRLNFWCPAMDELL
jgi:hypothetical protein